MIDVQVLNTKPIPSVQILVEGFAQRSIVEITRSPAGVVPGGVVRGSPKTVDTGGAVLLYDIEYPWAEPLVYRAVVRDAATGAVVEEWTSGAVSPPSTGMSGHLLLDPVRVRALVVDSTDETEMTTQFRGEVIALAGRRNPVVISDVRGGLEWTLTFYTDNKQQHDELLDLLAPGSAIIVQHTRDCWVLEGWVQPVDVAWKRTAKPTEREWTVSLVEIDPVPSDVETRLVTLETMHEWVPTTLEDLSTHSVSLLDLSLDVASWAASI